MFFPFFNQVDQAASHALKAQEIGGTVGFDVSGSLSDMAHGKCVHPPKKIYAYYEYGIVPHPKYAYNILVKASSAPSSSLNICNCIMYNAYLQLVTRVCLPEIPAGENLGQKNHDHRDQGGHGGCLYKDALILAKPPKNIAGHAAFFRNQCYFRQVWNLGKFQWCQSAGWVTPERGPKMVVNFQESYNTPLEHTPGNAPSQL